jgi:predicted dehydrogenase
VALVGAGHIAGTHLSGWRRTPCGEVVGLFDVDQAAASRRARQFGVRRVFTSLAEAIEGAQIVDVCTPPHTHPGILRLAAEAGRHVLVEKPVVTDAADWVALRLLFADGSLKLGVIHNLKFTRSVRQAARWIARGRIGRLLRVRHEFLTDPTSDRMLTAPHWSHTLPGGRWFETLPHALYLTHFLAGPLALSGVTALSTGRGIAGLPADEVAVSLQGEGVIATLHYSASCPANRRSLVIDGEKGVIAVDVLSDSALLECRRDGRLRRVAGPLPGGAVRRLAALLPDRGAYLVDHLTGRTPHARMIDGFARHVVREEAAPTPLDEVDYVIDTGEEIARRIEAAVRPGGGDGRS